MKYQRFALNQVFHLPYRKGKKETMKMTKPYNSEFALYESIVSGNLRPFLPEYSSAKYIESLAEIQEYDSVIEEFFSEEEKLSDDDDADEDFFSEIEKLLDNVEEGELGNLDTNTNKENSKLDLDINFEKQLPIGKRPMEPLSPDLQLKLLNQDIQSDLEIEELKFCKFEDLEIPRPPDEKSEYFLSLIENEFEEIKKRAKKFLQNVQDENLISSFANKNLQKAKKLAIDSGKLSRLLNKDDSDSSGNSESYIINALEVFLTRSILFYQSLFEPLLKNPLLTENELRAYVDNPYVFSFKGEYWQVNFNGEETLVQNLERIRYIVHLLENPNKEFYCYELTKMVKMIQPEINEFYSSMGEDELAREGLSLVDLSIENLTRVQA